MSDTIPGASFPADFPRLAYAATVRLLADNGAATGYLDAGDIPAGAVLQQAASGAFYADLGAAINRANDRLFVGAATQHDGTSAPKALDWLSQLVNWPVFNATAAITSPVGKIALTTGSRASDLDYAHAGTTQTTIGTAAFAINDVSATFLAAFGFYAEAHVKPGAQGTAFCAEYDAINWSTVVGPSTPYHQLYNGSAVGVWCASGGGLAGVKDALCAYAIVQNGAKFETGISFGRDALSGCDGTTGFGIALALAKGHLLQWYTPEADPGGIGPFITSTVAAAANATSLQFQDGGLLVVSKDSKALLTVQAVTGSANGLSVQAAATGSAPILKAVGADTNVNLGLYPQGNGILQTTAPLAATATAGADTLPAAPAGFLPFNVNGVTYKIPLYNN